MRYEAFMKINCTPPLERCFTKEECNLKITTVDKVRQKELHNAIAYQNAVAIPRAFDIVAPTIRRNSVYSLIKRCFDIIISLISGVILLIPMLIIAILVRIDSPGPAIFKQERLGKDWKPFTILKFRSMRLDAEADGPQWADREDSRCTRIGRILRNSRLDELPQLWNILKGDMSFVGPRPERACFYKEFETYIHGFRNRLLVKPGLTGYAQVNGGYELKPEEKIVYDMEYIKKQSILFDLRCILKTVTLIFTHEGAR